MLIWSQLIVPASDPTTDPDAMNLAETFSPSFLPKMFRLM